MHDLTSLLLVTVLFAAARPEASANPLLDFELQGDETLLPESDDCSSEEVLLSTPFVFYGSPQSSLYVSRMLTITQPCFGVVSPAANCMRLKHI